eukprot:2803599-Amphidinium_carterae.1
MKPPLSVKSVGKPPLYMPKQKLKGEARSESWNGTHAQFFPSNTLLEPIDNNELIDNACGFSKSMEQGRHFELHGRQLELQGRHLELQDRPLELER